MSEKYFIFSSGICNCNPEVTAADVANNILIVIKAAANCGVKVLAHLTINCTPDEDGKNFSKDVICTLKNYIKENNLEGIVFLDEEYISTGPMGAENSDMHNRSRTSEKIEEIFGKDPDAKIACIYKVDQDDRLSEHMITDAIKILNGDNEEISDEDNKEISDEDKNKNLSLVYPVSFMFKNKLGEEFIIVDIDGDTITILNIKTNEPFKITRTKDSEKPFSYDPNNENLDDAFSYFLFSKYYLNSTVKDPTNHNYGQYRIDVIKDFADFKKNKRYYQ